MTRVLARLCLLVASLALVLGVAPQIAFAPDAGAQVGVDADGDGFADESVDANPSGGGVSFVPADVQPNPDGDTGNDDVVGGTGGGDASPGLAVTGSEVEPIMAISLGLLALGGSALVTSRRRLHALD